MPATLAALDAPGISGLYYVDLDAVARWPWTVDESLFRVHRAGQADVSFLWEYPTTARGGAPASDDPLRWLVHGSRFYVRDSPNGRAFFARSETWPRVSAASRSRRSKSFARRSEGW